MFWEPGNGDVEYVGESAKAVVEMLALSLKAERRGPVEQEANGPLGKSRATQRQQ